MHNVLESYWYIVCSSSDLTSKPFAFSLFSRNLVAFRRKSGDVAVFEDRCLHRNAPLSQGRVINDSLECPYHGWCYEASGKVSKIPSLPANEPLPNNLKLLKYPCIEQDGYVWTSLSESPTLPKPESFPFLGQTGWKSFRMKTRFKAGIEACLENFLDCPHAQYVHNFWFRSPTGKQLETIVRHHENGVSAEYLNEPQEKSMVWWILAKKNCAVRHIDRFIAPATTRVDYEYADGRHFIITSSCAPINEGETEVHTVITSKAGWFSFIKQPILKWLAHRIILQDVSILNQQQANIARFDGKARYRYVSSDLLGPHIAQWRNTLHSGSATSPTEESVYVNMRF